MAGNMQERATFPFPRSHHPSEMNVDSYGSTIFKQWYEHRNTLFFFTMSQNLPNMRLKKDV